MWDTHDFLVSSSVGFDTGQLEYRVQPCSQTVGGPGRGEEVSGVCVHLFGGLGGGWTLLRGAHGAPGASQGSQGAPGPCRCRKGAPVLRGCRQLHLPIKHRISKSWFAFRSWLNGSSEWLAWMTLLSHRQAGCLPTGCSGNGGLLSNFRDSRASLNTRISINCNRHVFKKKKFDLEVEKTHTCNTHNTEQ